jgi:hypothetical protein
VFYCSRLLALSNVCLTKQRPFFAACKGKMNALKTQVHRLKTSLFLLCVAFCFNAAIAQDSSDSVQSAIESKRFAFRVQSVMPTGGAIRQENWVGYGIRVAGDSLIADLPYFGRAFTAPVGNGGGIRFTSTEFEYAVKNRRKGGWEITIHPKDATDLRQFVLTVSEAGNATLRALSNNRQPISYNGNVAVLK